MRSSSGTSMGANYREANKAQSKDDFLYKPAARGSGRKRMGNWNAQVIGRDGSASRPRRFRRNRPTGFNTALVRQNIQVIGKISIIEKESNETVFWFEVLLESQLLPARQREAGQPLYAEVVELLKLFSSISRSSRHSKPRH